jgi:hypothetical protein
MSDGKQAIQDNVLTCIRNRGEMTNTLKLQAIEFD